MNKLGIHESHLISILFLAFASLATPACLTTDPPSEDNDLEANENIDVEEPARTPLGYTTSSYLACGYICDPLHFAYTYLFDASCGPTDTSGYNAVACLLPVGQTGFSTCDEHCPGGYYVHHSLCRPGCGVCLNGYNAVACYKYE